MVHDGSSSSSASGSASVSDTSSHADLEQQAPQGGNPAVLFPWKLHEMLKDATAEHKENVVSWLPEGKAFKVHSVPEFLDILP